MMWKAGNIKWILILCVFTFFIGNAIKVEHHTLSLD
jgi:hypothetical protein